MKDTEIIGLIKTYVKQTLVGMGALKGAPCQVQGVVDEGDGTQTLTLKWVDNNGDSHTTEITLPTAVFEIVNPTNGQTIRYNGTSGKWENSNVSFSADLGDLDDVVITSAQDGQVLTYDAANNQWINADGSTVADLGDLTDVTITSVQNGQLLSYNSTSGKWVNVSLDIDDLGNVSITNASDGQILTYNGTSGKWENKALDSDASDVDYDNTTSQMQATNVQGAIDENAGEIKQIKLDIDQLSASKIGYDGTTSGLSANKVQGAIDELADEKVDKESGKGLSSNDFTDALKNKLDGIEEGAEVNDISEVKVNGTALTPDANKAVNILLNTTKLSDVDLTGLADDYILIYDAANNKWIVGPNTGATYTAGDGIEIDQNNKISSKIVLFTGTEAQWNALPLADKIKFTHYATNDDQTGQIDAVPTQNSANLMTSGGIFNAFESEIGALDVTDTAVAGSYVTAVSETDGKIAVTREAADANPTASSNKMVKSGGVYSDEQDIYAVMGQNGAKNLIAFDPYTDNITGTWTGNTYTTSGVTFTVNNDGSILVNGTATSSPVIFTLSSGDQSKVLKSGKRYILSGAPANMNCALKFGTLADISNGGSATFIYDGVIKKVQIAIRNNATINNLTYYPMIRLVTDTDSTYAPPAKTNLQLTEDSVTWDDLSEVGAVNYCKNKATTGTTTDGTTTYTWTVNDDKSVTVSAPSYPVTVASGQNFSTWAAISSSECVPLLNKAWRLSGCPSGGSNSSYRLQIFRVLSADGSSGNVYDTGDGILFSWLNNGSGQKSQVTINLLQGCVLTGPLTFKPMIAPVSYNGPYVPYAKTNRELTEGEVFSTSEVKTNKVWIDGKPIYRKCFEGTLPTTAGSFSVNHGITNLGQVINQYGMTTPDSAGAMRQLDFAWYGSIDWDCCIYTNSTTIRVQHGSEFTSFHGGKKIYIVLEYTKS